MNAGIAVVGMACRYPDAGSPLELWENVLAQRRAFRRIPEERLRLDDYGSPDPATPDTLYATEAAVLEGWEFDRVRFRIAGSAFRSADLVHWLALDVASRALEHAGFGEGAGLPRETTGAVIGNTLTGEFSRANTLRLRWPYVRRVVQAELGRTGLSPEERRALIERLERSYKEPFAPVGEETLAGGLSNTIAGRLCNFYDWKGGGYTVDGACAASLLAVITAGQSLLAGDLDVAIAGGVDLSLDPFELVGFAKTGALARDEMRVYDVRSQGFWPGEGCGIVVLMRERDAREQGRAIHAVIRGWGVSSDGSGGITRPEVEGQMLAVARAYRRAGVGAHTVGYFEGHGTGTVVGDATELQVLGRARREAGAAPPAAIGSVKANIGHTKAAAGVAGLIKAVQALGQRTIPPTTGCERPHPELAAPEPVLEAPREGRDWPAGVALRAAVSAMGFGGINTHVVIDAAEEASAPARAPHPRTRALLDSAQDAELFLFDADDARGLAEAIERVAAYARRLSRAELTDLAAALAARLGARPARAAVVAACPADLARGLATLGRWLGEGVRERIDAEAGMFLGGARAARIAYLFSGQASPAYLRGGALARRFAEAREAYALGALPASGDTVATALAQPAIVTASLAGLAALAALGIEAEAAAGHSLGEITALHWAGVMDAPALLEIARTRGRAMMATPGPPSGMLSVAASAHDVESLLVGTPVVVAGLNLPGQTVVSGAAEALAGVAARARARGWRVAHLPVSHAFHSPLMAPAAPALAARVRATRLAPLGRPVFSTITGQRLAPDTDVADLLSHQLTSPVRFMEAVATMGRVDLAIEVGPGHVLTGMARQLLSCPVVALDAGGESIAGLLAAAGAAWALGAPLRHEALFAGRFARPFALDWRPRFLANPCEQAPVSEDDGARAPQASGAEAAAAPVLALAAAGPDDVLARVRRRVAERVELPLEAVRPASRLLDDLHMNSIAVGQVVVALARELGLEPSASPTEYADATVAEVAHALSERLRTGEPARAAEERSPAGIEAWIRPFVVARMERPAPPLPRGEARSEDAPAWTILAAPDHPLRAAIQRRFAGVPGGGTIACLPAEPEASAIDLLLEAARQTLATHPRGAFVVVQQQGGGGGFARTLHLESPQGTTCVVEVPFDHASAAEWVAREVAAAAGYAEARYDARGVRTEPVLRLLEPPEGGAPPLGPGDVLLVTGGGKGIAAECALALARDCGCMLALLGRSDPTSGPELAANLERFAAAGIRHVYQVADVTDAAAVRAAVASVERALGPVTAVLHGAGVNTPELIRSLERDAVDRTVAAKVRGAEHVLAAVDPARLKLFAAFGSIIARTGLRGEADYALANEWLTLWVEGLAQRAPRCRALSIEWSVWSGVGMGERLGRIDALTEQGITPIGVDQGIAIFRRLVSASLPAAAVVVSGRPPALPTLGVEPRELPLLRFLERPRVHVPGVELVVDADLAAHADPYVEDHVFGGLRLFPAVMGLEAMAQAAMALTGSERPPAFEDVRFERPIAVAEEGATLRVAALVRSRGVVDVALRCRDTGFEVDHFRATCRMDPAESIGAPATHGAHEAAANGSEGAGPNGASHGGLVPLDPERDLYGGILFHRGRFKRLKGYRALRATACVAELTPDGQVEWFGRYLPPALVLGDPAARDGAIHAVQACIPHATILPIGVERVEIEPVPASEPRVVEATEVGRDAQTLVYDVVVRDASGRVRERWHRLALRIMGDAARPAEWPAALLATHVERRLAELVRDARARVALLEDGGADRHGRSDAAIGAALGRHEPVRRRPDGKPEARNGEPGHVSAAHAGRLTLAVAGDRPVGCDLEAVAARSEADWRGLLGDAGWAAAARLSAEAGEAIDVCATRVWSAIECAKKAGVPAEPLRAAGLGPDGWAAIEIGRRAVATLATRVRGAEGPLVLAVLATRD